METLFVLLACAAAVWCCYRIMTGQSLIPSFKKGSNDDGPFAPGV